MKLKDLFEDNVDRQSNSQFFKTYEETRNWLDMMGIKNYEINKDTLVVDVDDHVDISNKNLKNIPVKFGKVGDWFSVSGNKNLKSLIGCPDSMKTIHCGSIGIKNFNSLGSVKIVAALDIKSLESFEGLPNELEFLSIGSSCRNVNSLDHFPKMIRDRLIIRSDFKWVDTLYEYMDMCSKIYLVDEIGKYDNILKLLYVKGINGISSYAYVKGINGISSYANEDHIATDILNAEIKRQPDPRKRNLLKVAQELSNAGFHHLTV